jgi:hypothetical protein
MPILGEFTVLVSADGRRKFKMPALRAFGPSDAQWYTQAASISRRHIIGTARDEIRLSNGRPFDDNPAYGSTADVLTVCKMIGAWTLIKRVWQQVGRITCPRGCAGGTVAFAIFPFVFRSAWSLIPERFADRRP